jgi:hypothetical protein
LNFDRLKAGFIGAARAAFPRIDYLALYAGTIVAQGGANSFDVQPDDARVPGLSQVPIELGLPGLTLQLDLNSKPRCLIGWKNGNPALPYVTLFESGAAALKVTFDATELDLGAAAADFAVKGTSFKAALDTWDAGWTTFLTGMNTFAVSADATLGTALTAVVAAMQTVHANFIVALANILSTKVKVE